MAKLNKKLLIELLKRFFKKVNYSSTDTIINNSEDIDKIIWFNTTYSNTDSIYNCIQKLSKNHKLIDRKVTIPAYTIYVHKDDLDTERWDFNFLTYYIPYIIIQNINYFNNTLNK